MVKKEGKIEKVYFTIGEVAELFEVNASLIRFWEKEFDFFHPHKNKKGNRLFTKQDIDKIRLIYHLVKEKGYTLQGAREKIMNNREDVDRQVEIVDSLKRIKSFLLELKNDLP
jgi:DNA-binding transcriptional MerR regulator